MPGPAELSGFCLLPWRSQINAWTHRERGLSPASVKFAASGLLCEFLFVVVVVVLLLHPCNI